MKLYWIRRLIADLKRNPKKASGCLSARAGGHCCLGRLALLHGGSFRRDRIHRNHELFWNGENTGETALLPLAFADLVGLTNEEQFTLSNTNDSADNWAPVIEVLEGWKVKATKGARR